MQIFLLPDEAIKPIDLKPRFEVSDADVIARKRREVSTSEVENKIVHMKTVDFYANVTRLSVN